MMRALSAIAQLFAIAALAAAEEPLPRPPPDLVRLDNGTVKVGLDQSMGASITHLSWTGHAGNAVNSYDPGRLIQQSYYAGIRIDRRAEGQHEAWSPWNWNPIQGGGVGSWSEVKRCEKLEDGTVFSVTIPKLWDMSDEPAAALMHQWTGFEPSMPNVVRVRCELVSKRDSDDRWGPARRNHQEVPATYFIRCFDTFRSYLGDGRWRLESCKFGPPWSRTKAPRDALACFASNGQGIAIFSPEASTWNYGPTLEGDSDDPLDPACVHIAGVTTAELGRRSTYRYRYWIVVGKEKQIAKRLDELWVKYSSERAELRVEE